MSDSASTIGATPTKMIGSEICIGMQERRYPQFVIIRIAIVQVCAQTVVFEESESVTPRATANQRNTVVSTATAAKPIGFTAPDTRPRSQKATSRNPSQRVPQTAPNILARRISSPLSGVAV